ncbi:hypothetical protein NCS56_00864800 [Fusarium sp. Ph1]|nr:hypothetical protein NCS56_00864800 [Fusarium sp. Ph1]
MSTNFSAIRWPNRCISGQCRPHQEHKPYKHDQPSCVKTRNGHCRINMSYWDLNEFRLLYIEVLVLVTVPFPISDTTLQTSPQEPAKGNYRPLTTSLNNVDKHRPSKMPRENHRRRTGDSERSGRIPRGRFNPYERPRFETDARSVTDEQVRHARERLGQVLANVIQRANGSHAEAEVVEEQEAEELLDLLMAIDQHRQQRLEQHLEEGRQERPERPERRRRRRRRRRRGRPIPARSLQTFPALRQMPMMQQQPQEPTLPPLIANSTTDMAPAPAPSVDEQPTWEFDDWFDGEYLDQLLSDYLHPEGQELVQEVARQVEQLSLASNLAQEVAGLGEQLVSVHVPIVSPEGLVVNGNGPTASELNEEPNGQRQGDDRQLPR